MAAPGADDGVDSFVLGLGLEPEAGAFLRELPDDVRAKVLRSFNPRGTKDGNVFGRLQAFAMSMLQPPGASAGRSAEATEWVPREREQRPQRAAPPPMLAHAPAAEYMGGHGLLQLDEPTNQFLQALPEGVRNTVIAEFDPRGTKDGNVFGRLLGFARAIWAQRLGLDPAQRQEAVVLLRNLPEEVQARVMTQFDFSGTKDGNILARLSHFAHSVASRFGGGGGGGGGVGFVGGGGGGCGGGGAPVYAAPPQPVIHHRVAERAPAPQPRMPALAAPSSLAAAASGFVARMGLDSVAAGFLQALPEDVLSTIISSFSPSGTKDGNIWGRLFGFVRSVWVQRLGLDAGAIELLKSLPEETQRVVMVKFDPSRTKDGNIGARLESFARSITDGTQGWGGGGGAGGQRLGKGMAGGHHAPAAPVAAHRAAVAAPMQPQLPMPVREFARRWGLNAEASAFVGSLPEPVWQAVTESFDASGTKDGNVWGRLFGFVRSVWSQRLGLNGQAFAQLRGMPEEAQMALMACSEGEALAQLQGHPAALAAPPATWRQPPPNLLAQVPVEPAWGGPPPFHGGLGGGGHAGEGEGDIAAFVHRCGLDHEAEGFLHGLLPDVQAAVIKSFDASGTKDGNVFGRLQGFARSVEARLKRGHGGQPAPQRNVRPRLQDSGAY